MNMMTEQPMSDMFHEERRAFAELARDLARKRLIENMEEHDRYPFVDLFTEAIWDAGAVGFYGVNLPADYSGVDMNTGMVAVILEQLSRYDASLACVIFTNAAALEIIRIAAGERDCSKIYKSISSSGTAPLAFQSFTGPDEMEMPIVDGSGRITGNSMFMVLGNIAEYAVIPARREGAAGYSWYLINCADESINKSEPLVSLGMHACPAIDISLNKTPGMLIGDEGKGQNYYDAMHNGMSLCASAISLGIMKGSLDSAMEYTSNRYQGGRQIIDWSQVRMMLANMAVETKIGEACFLRACQERDNNHSGWEFTARAAAIHTGEMAVKSTADGVQLFGGNGYMKDYPQEKRFRDARQAQCLLGMAPLKKINYIARHIDAG